MVRVKGSLQFECIPLKVVDLLAWFWWWRLRVKNSFNLLDISTVFIIYFDRRESFYFVEDDTLVDFQYQFSLSSTLIDVPYGYYFPHLIQNVSEGMHLACIWCDDLIITIGLLLLDNMFRLLVCKSAIWDGDSNNWDFALKLFVNPDWACSGLKPLGTWC